MRQTSMFGVNIGPDGAYNCVTFFKVEEKFELY
jgi:hypothetical protein